jgi:hypothetical protein
MLQEFLKNKNISKKLKLRLKNTIIDKVLTYASETWTLTERDRKQLNVFERKMRGMEEAPENSKESSNSAHASGMNEFINDELFML